jgi:hypothetical protein
MEEKKGQQSEEDIIKAIREAARKVQEQKQSNQEPALAGDAAKATQKNIEKKGRVWEDNKKK